METARRRMPPRHEFRLGTRQLAIFGGAFVLIWALTFVLGVLVGRELTRTTAPRTGATLGERSSVPAPAATAEHRDPGPAKKGERAPSEERLTFYKTLTAPTLDLPPPQRSKIEERIVPQSTPVTPLGKRERRPAEVTETGAAPAEAATLPPPVRAQAGTEAGAASALASTGPARPWTVQVSSFRSRALAEELRGRLQAKGFDAYLTRVATDEGRIWHRVRVGAYSTRAEAERVASELRGERNLNPVVTSRTR